MSSEKVLKMSFEPKTIEHLGVKMYSHIPPALAELIANAYDACAENVHIKLYDNEKRIIVADDGDGMTFDEINQYFLRIGRNRRDEHQESTCGRIPTGKKGLGKLALFGIGNKINITTVKEGKEVAFNLDWNEISNWEGGNDYTPTYVESDSNGSSGTTITLKELNRVSDFPLMAYAISISKFFNFKDENFKVYLSLNDGEPILVDNKLKYENIDPEFEWEFPKTSTLIEYDFDKKMSVYGKIITTEKPLKPGLRGVTLFANGRMVNAPEFFGATESSHFFSYTTGWLDVDFIDDDDADLISTDRQSINWEAELTRTLKIFLKNMLRYVETDWRKQRKEKRKDRVQENTSVNIANWLNTVPKDIKEQLDILISKVDESELSTEDQSATIESLHTLIPEYPHYHWRYLNDSIKQVSKEDYENGDYLRAAGESVKLYEKKVKDRSKLDKIGVDLMGKAFGPETEPLKVSPNVTETDKNIEKGQKHMSIGLMSGFRNPAMHEPKNDIYPAIYGDVDCLDLLSMMSYLFNKLDGVRNINETE